MTANDILRYTATDGLTLQVYPCVTSTNALAKDCGERGDAEGTVIIAAEQTAGRGRLGRVFYSPANTGLYMSILLRPSIPPTEALSVTTAAAVAICRAIERVSDKTAQIKWVNDVFCDGKKVCGILTEAALDAKTGSLSYAVLGIGINVQDPDGGFPAELSGIAASVFGKKDGDRAALAAAVLDEFFAIYRCLEAGTFVEEYRRRSMLAGRSILVSTSHGDREATAIEVDGDCRLRVRYASGEEATLSFGDVRIRI